MFKMNYRTRADILREKRNQTAKNPASVGITQKCVMVTMPNGDKKIIANNFDVLVDVRASTATITIHE